MDGVLQQDSRTMVNKVPKTIKVWYLFFYVNRGKSQDATVAKRKRERRN